MKCPVCNDERTAKKFLFHRYDVCVCKNCRFQWLDPQPTDSELAEIYNDSYFLGKDDPQTLEIVYALKRATAALYLQQFMNATHLGRDGSQHSILEIGCGMGDFLLEAQSKGFDVAGLEVTDHLVELTNQRLGVPCVQKGTIESVNFPPNSFDMIAFFDVIEHVRDISQFMGKVRSSLKDSGKIFLATPSLDSGSARLLGEHWMEYKVEHISYFGRESMLKLLEKTGFHKVQFIPNYKILNFDYINRHFVRFPVKGLSPLVNGIRKITPRPLAFMPVKVIASGMALIAEKRAD